MGEALVVAWFALQATVSAALVVAQRSLLARAPAPRCVLPAASVLKPLRGRDDGLEENLASVFRQVHPRFEVLLGAADADDAALEVARRVAAAHPHVPSRVIADARRTGLNPKVDNLANLARHASHEVLVVSDSNVAVPPTWLADVCARLQERDVALVSSPIRARPGRTLGSRLESLQLNTYVMGGVGALTLWARSVCCIGKSMAFRRSDLDRIGGFGHLGRHLAEDQVCAEDLARAGRRVTVDATPVENVLGPVSVGAFCARHLRWARIRRWMNPAGYAAEILSNPVAWFAAALAALPAGDAACGVAALVALRAVCDAAMERRLGVRRPLIHYVPLLLLKEGLLAALWAVPFAGRTVTWRGNRLRIGRRTLLEAAERPSSAAAPGPSADAAAAGA